MSIPGSQILISSAFAHQKERDLLKEMVASGAEAGLHKMSLEHFVVPENKEVTMIITVKDKKHITKEISNLKEF